MARRQLKTDDEEGFLIAYYYDLRETEILYNVRIETHIQLTSKQGELRINHFAYRKPRKPGDEPIGSSSTPYPTPAALKLHAALYRSAVRIGGELANKGLERHQEENS